MSPKKRSRQEEARQLLQTARTALSDMKEELRDAKKILADIVSDAGGNIQNPEDVEKAKKIYQSGLTVHIITEGDDPKSRKLMTKMYALFEKIFPLEEEREELEKLLGMNKRKTSDNPMLEQWILLEDKSGNIVAARNVTNISFVNADDYNIPFEGVQSLNYTFVDPKSRSLGLGEYTLEIAVAEGRKFIGETYPLLGGLHPDHLRMLEIAEQNAPLKLSMEAMLLDTAGAKTDQFWRREYYESINFREVDFPYKQMPLMPRDAGGKPAEGLNLIARNASGSKTAKDVRVLLTSIPANALSLYLESYALFIADGAYDVFQDPAWVEQSRVLEVKKAEGGKIAVKAKQDFKSIKAQTWDFAEKFVCGAVFNDVAFKQVEIGALMGVKDIPLMSASDNVSTETRKTKEHRPKP